MKTSEFRVLAALVAVLLISHGLSAVAAPKAIEGTVFHAESGALMAGVFVFAQYKQSGSQPFGHSASWCVMTRRCLHRQRWTLSVSRRARHCSHIDGHFSQFHGTIGPEVHRVHDLVRNQEANHFTEPVHGAAGSGADERTEAIVCDRPRTKADAVANIEYLQLLLTEDKKYEPAHASGAVESMIRTLAKQAF
ncbi:hypothetical protein LP420_03340 [Massilia sp. B-10]|nr:hypothetical protein LP420_03340 [Massilia sp. B-10]